MDGAPLVRISAIPVRYAARFARVQGMRLRPAILAFSFCGLVHASTVPLTQSVDLPIVVEGRTVGSMKLPAGSEVEIVSNDGTNAVIKRGGTTYTIAADSLPSTSEPAAPSASTSSAQPTPIAKAQEAVAPILPSKTIDKTLNESTMVPFFVPVGEHAPSIIDGSRLNDEMPGKNGWLSVKNGHLYNGEKRLRIAGVNVFLPVTDNEIAEMKKYGFNGARISVPGTFNKKSHTISRNSLQSFFNGSQIDPEGLHLLDEQVAKFINAGFWVDLNLRDDPGAEESDDSTRELFKKYLSALFNHVNPYTGRSYANEPAIFSVEIANEFGAQFRLYHNDGNAYKFDPLPFKQSITTKWNKWLTDRYKTQGGLDAAWPGNNQRLGSVEWMTPLGKEKDPSSKYSDQQKKDWYFFGIDLEVDYSKDIVEFLHNECHYPGLVITGCSVIKMGVRRLGDAAMVHMYQDISEYKSVTGDTKRTHERIFGKPFLVTECNIMAPNPYLGETALAMLAAGTAQDWDGVFFFQWEGHFSRVIHSEIKGPENMIKGPNSVRENSALMTSLPTAINLFRRGDAAPLKNKSFRKNEESGKLFEHQVGTVFPETPIGSGGGEVFAEPGTYSFDGSTMNIASPKTVLSIGTSTNNELGGIRFQIGKTQLGWSCASVTSLNNDLPIKDANRLLVTLIGKTGNTGSSILKGIGEEVTVLEDGGTNAPITKEAYLKAFGTAPVITECISANVFIPVDTSKGTFKAYALDEKAQRKEEIPLEVAADGITLHTTGKEGTVWYEIARK